MRVLGCASVSIATICGAATRNDNMLIPAAPQRYCTKFIKAEHGGVKIRPPKMAALSFAQLPFWSMAATTAVFFLLAEFDLSNAISQTLFCAAFAVELFWLMFRIDLPCRVGITVYKEKALINTFSKFKLVSVMIPLENITGIQIEQNPFQRRGNRFHLCLYVNMYRLRLKHLRCDDAVLGEIEKLF